MTKCCNRTFLTFIFLYLGFSCGTEEKPAQEAAASSGQLPNVIYILADDMGIGDVHAFNPDGKIPTPNLDQMARLGMKFSDAHTTSGVCTPTRYALLTGRYNWRTHLKQGVLTGKDPALIPGSRTTVASLLKSQGYHTAFIGKWHLGWDWTLKEGVDNSGTGWNAGDFEAIDFSGPVTNNPNDLGFDYAYGHPSSLDIAPYVYVENGRVTALPDTVTVNDGKYSWWREGPTGSDFDHYDVTPNFFRRSMQYVEERAQSPDPFFLYLALPSPHTPILPEAEWQGKSGLNPYADFVMMVDAYVGRLLAAVNLAGVEENTLVIFTSDNGCAPAAKIEELIAGDHYPSYIYRGHKADIYEGGHRVPFIARWPARIPAAIENKQLVCITDLMATLAEITGYPLKPDEGEDSYSMMPLFTKQPTDQPVRESAIHHSMNGSFAIRKGDWKLIMAPGSGGWSYPRPEDPVSQTLPQIQLYNLAEDPGEENNLQDQRPELVEELKSLLTRHILEGRSTPGPAQSNDPIDFEWEQIEFIEN
jgi:arylsulfatase A-like enzyme